MRQLLALAGILALLAACSSEQKSPSSKSDWGTGLNTVERKYSKPASDTYDAAVAAVKSFDLTIDSDRHDELGGEVVGHDDAGTRGLGDVHVAVDAAGQDQEAARVDLARRPRDLLGHRHDASIANADIRPHRVARGNDGAAPDREIEFGHA